MSRIDKEKNTIYKVTKCAIMSFNHIEILCVYIFDSKLIVLS